MSPAVRMHCRILPGRAGNASNPVLARSAVGAKWYFVLISDRRRLDFLIETGAWMLQVTTCGKWAFLVPDTSQRAWAQVGTVSDTPRGAIDAALAARYKKAIPRGHLSTHPTWAEQLARLKAVLALRENGKTYRAIGAEIGLSRGRIQQLVRAAERTRRFDPAVFA